jgi:hypothetical protein
MSDDQEKASEAVVGHFDPKLLGSSWPGLSRPSRLGWQGLAFLSEIAGTSPAMTTEMCRIDWSMP